MSQYTTHTAFFLASSLVLLLTGCPAAEDKGVADTASDTSSPYPEAAYGESEALVAMTGAEYPGVMMFLISLLSSFGDPTSCPAVISEDAATEETTMQGGCTNEDGVSYEGTATVSESSGTLVFSDFGWSDAGAGVSLNATMEVSPDDEVMTTNGTLIFSNLSTDSVTEYLYNDHVLDNLSGFFGALFSEDGSYVLSGGFEIIGIDTFTVDGAVQEQGECADERDSFSLTLTGTRGTLTYSESKDSCDGCTEWSSGEDSGSICHETDESE